jgi:acetylornithine deacetylase/succinyl-diaminopimelate desuccinylase-like protein
VGTVGKLTVLPGAANVIPQDVEFTVDVRSADDASRRRAIVDIVAAFDAIGRRRRVSVDAAPFFDADAAPCDAALQRRFAEAIAAHGTAVRSLPSGAGHDAMVFPAVAPMAMLFVRCGNRGISHHPDETMTAEDAEVATSVLLHFFEHFDPVAFARDGS